MRARAGAAAAARRNRRRHSIGRIAARTARLALTAGPAVVAMGVALATRVPVEGSSWSTTFPALLVVAVGTATAVAPLTSAVMASVDRAHVGMANGLNSAMAQPAD